MGRANARGGPSSSWWPRARSGLAGRPSSGPLAERGEEYGSSQASAGDGTGRTATIIGSGQSAGHLAGARRRLLGERRPAPARAAKGCGNRAADGGREPDHVTQPGHPEEPAPPWAELRLPHLLLQLPRRGVQPGRAGRRGVPSGRAGPGRHRPRRHVRGGPVRPGRGRPGRADRNRAQDGLRRGAECWRCWRGGLCWPRGRPPGHPLGCPPYTGCAGPGGDPPDPPATRWGAAYTGCAGPGDPRTPLPRPPARSAVHRPLARPDGPDSLGR